MLQILQISFASKGDAEESKSRDQISHDLGSQPSLVRQSISNEHETDKDRTLYTNNDIKQDKVPDEEAFSAFVGRCDGEKFLLLTNEFGSEKILKDSNKNIGKRNVNINELHSSVGIKINSIEKEKPAVVNVDKTKEIEANKKIKNKWHDKDNSDNNPSRVKSSKKSRIISIEENSLIKQNKSVFPTFSANDLENYCAPTNVPNSGIEEKSCRVSGKCFPRDLYSLETCALCYQYIPRQLFYTKLNIITIVVRQSGNSYLLSYLSNGTHKVSTMSTLFIYY